jgi:hypothetical protein
MPLTLQFTAVFVEFTTVAVNCCVALAWRVAVEGATSTVTGRTEHGFVLPAIDTIAAEVGVRSTSAVSCRPASSETVTHTWAVPEIGARSVPAG